MRLSVLVSLLIPALAFAQPKGKAKPKPKTPPTAKPADEEKPAPPDKDTKDTKEPKDAKTDKDTKGGGGGGNGGGDPKKDEAKKDDAKPDAKAEGEPEPPKTGDVDVDTLRQEYLSLRDELFKSRARANAVASALYSTRIQIKLTYTTARYYNPGKATIRLDGASVFENATGVIGGDDGVRFDGYVAPGRHLITFRVEATGKDDDSFTSVTENQIVVKAVAGKDLIVAAKARDSGDIAYEWKKKEKGSYGLGLDVSVKTTGRTDGAADAKPTPAQKGKK